MNRQQKGHTHGSEPRSERESKGMGGDPSNSKCFHSYNSMRSAELMFQMENINFKQSIAMLLHHNCVSIHPHSRPQVVLNQIIQAVKVNN